MSATVRMTYSCMAPVTWLMCVCLCVWVVEVMMGVHYGITSRLIPLRMSQGFHSWGVNGISIWKNDLWLCLTWFISTGVVWGPSQLLSILFYYLLTGQRLSKCFDPPLSGSLPQALDLDNNCQTPKGYCCNERCTVTCTSYFSSS